LIRRVWQHREGVTDGFTHEYRVKRLVWSGLSSIPISTRWSRGKSR